MSAVGPPPTASAAIADGSVVDAKPTTKTAWRRSRKAKVLGAVGAVALVGVIGTAIGLVSGGGGGGGAGDSSNMPVPPDGPPALVDSDPRVTISTLSSAASQAGFVGCFADTAAREMEFRAVLDPNWMTPGACVNACRWVGYSFAAVQYGRECWCSQRNSGAPLDIGRCDMDCSGDPSSKCGGRLANQVYRAATPYVGCFVDGWRQRNGQQRRVLEHRARLDEARMTPAMCVNECSRLGYKYAGVQYGRECWCGNEHDLKGAAPQEECNWQCTGTAAESCGGFLRNDVYSADQPMNEQGLGFARGVTGGGNAPEQRPSSPQQLAEWLKDDVPRVILLDKEMSFLGTEGVATEEGCRPSHHQQCVGRGQDMLRRAGHCEGDEPRVQITFDRAGERPLEVSSHKTLRGVGAAGVIKGKGLRIRGRNVMVQNIHITEINPHVIWGGDGINVWGDKVNGKEVSSDLVWIDHVKFSRIGRQMITTGFGGSGRLTVSFSEFDGRTDFSASCDGRHYWTALLYGNDSRVTMVRNHVHHTSGRAPKLGGSAGNNVVVHAANNVWTDNTGHDFDVGAGGVALVEGNFFERSRQPVTRGSAAGDVFVPYGEQVWLCGDALRRGCWANAVVDSGALTGGNSGPVLNALRASQSLVSAVSAEETRRTMLGNRRLLRGEELAAPAHFGTVFTMAESADL